MVFKSGESAGQSGSFFFFSLDNKFIIKTLSSSDKKKLTEIMSDYCAYLTKNNDSLLARIYGMFSINRPLHKSVDIIIMQNTCLIKEKTNKIFSFDLKGS